MKTSPNKPIKQDKKQFAVFRTSNILANHFLPLIGALGAQSTNGENYEQ